MGDPKKFVEVQKYIDICSALPYRKPPFAKTWLRSAQGRVDFHLQTPVHSSSSLLGLLSPITFFLLLF